MSDYTWDKAIENYEKACRMSCKPDFQRLPKDYITDEDKSVKWNREQVEENHKQYDDAVKNSTLRKTNAVMKQKKTSIK